VPTPWGGPRARDLPIAPPDLTTLARSNGGAYSFDKVYRVVDGRGHMEGHGGAGMPTWGDAFRTADEGYSEVKVKAAQKTLGFQRCAIRLPVSRRRWTMPATSASTRRTIL
jgi:hypothetical protein